jgi:hypothetical protein
MNLPERRILFQSVICLEIVKKLHSLPKMETVKFNQRKEYRFIINEGSGNTRLIASVLMIPHSYRFNFPGSVWIKIFSWEDTNAGCF